MDVPLIVIAIVLAVVATGVTDWRVVRPAGMTGRRYRRSVLFDVYGEQGARISKCNQRREGHP